MISANESTSFTFAEVALRSVSLDPGHSLSCVLFFGTNPVVFTIATSATLRLTLRP